MTHSLRTLGALALLLLAAPAALALADVEADGPITGLTETSLTVDGVTFAITDATEIEDAAGDDTTADALAIGMRVEVDGDHATDGTLEADRIRIDDDSDGDGGDDGEDAEADGPIEAVDAGSITVQGLTFAIVDTTQIVDDNGDAVPADTLVVGLPVEVDGHAAADGSLVADRIEIDDDSSDDDGDGDDDGTDDDDDEDETDDEVELEGPITAITDTGIVVGAIAVRITDTTEIEGELAVGVHVEVEGWLDADGQVVAQRIEAEDHGGDDDGNGDEEDEEDVEVEGVIDALDGASLTVAGITFAITDATVVLDDDRRPISPTELALGLLVEVEGAYAADGVLVALRIKLEDFDDDEAEVTGTIEALEADALIVAGLRFEVSDQTVVLDDDRQPITFADLALGMTVEVRADVDGAGVRHATRIQIEDAVEDEVELTAALDAVGDGFVVAIGRAFELADGAVVPDGLAAGDVVEIHATRRPGGDLVATAIEREDDPATAVELRAPVTEVLQDTLVVLRVPFLIDAATAIVDRDGTATTLGAIAAGMRVEVDATVTPDGFVASRVQIRSAASVAGVVSGGTDATARSAALTVGGVALTLADDARIVSPSGAPLPSSALVAGQTVAAYGTTGPDGLVARRVVVFTAASAVATDETPTATATLRVFPNPTAGAATLEIALGAPADVTVLVYSALGREVARLGTRGAGAATVLDTTGLPAGVYLVRVLADGRPAAATTLTVVR